MFFSITWFIDYFLWNQNLKFLYNYINIICRVLNHNVVCVYISNVYIYIIHIFRKINCIHSSDDGKSSESILYTLHLDRHPFPRGKVFGKPLTGFPSFWVPRIDIRAGSRSAWFTYVFRYVWTEFFNCSLAIVTVRTKVWRIVVMRFTVWQCD